jgi:lysine-specific demethylase 3
MTSIFSSSWMCRLCGREACADCYALVCELTKDPPDSTPQQVQERQRRREKYAHGNPFFLSCTKRNEHQSECFSPMSRFFAEELDDAIEEMEKVVHMIQADPQNGDPGRGDENGGGGDAEAGSTWDADTTAIAKRPPLLGRPPDWTAVFKSKAIPRADFHPSLRPSASCLAGEPYVPPNLVEAATLTPYWEICRYTKDEVTPAEDPEKFARIWGHGEPVVVANILGDFTIDWSPEYFIQEFGDRECLITECEQDSNKKTTIKEFFGEFGKYEGRQGAVWKLKVSPETLDPADVPISDFVLLRTGHRPPISRQRSLNFSRTSAKPFLYQTMSVETASATLVPTSHPTLWPPTLVSTLPVELRHGFGPHPRPTFLVTVCH